MRLDNYGNNRDKDKVQKDKLYNNQPVVDIMEEDDEDDKDKDGHSMTPDHFKRLYVFTLMWCIGAFLELDDRCVSRLWDNDSLALFLIFMKEKIE